MKILKWNKKTTVEFFYSCILLCYKWISHYAFSSCRKVVSVKSVKYILVTLYTHVVMAQLFQPTSQSKSCRQKEIGFGGRLLYGKRDTESKEYCNGFNYFLYDDVIKWKHFPRYWPFVRGIHRSPVNSPHKGQWRGALLFSLICLNSWVNNHEAGDLRRHRAHYDVIVMECLGGVQCWMSQ